MGATGSLLSSLAGQQDDGEAQDEQEWAHKQVLRLVLFHEDRREPFTQWLRKNGREGSLASIALWLDVSLVKLNLMYIASNSEGSKDALLLAKYSSPVSIQLHHLLSTRLPTVDLSIPADVTEYCSDLVAQEPASLLEGPDAANDLVDFVEEIEEALLDFLLPDFSGFTAEAEPAQEPGPGPAQGGEAATTEGEPTDLSVDVQELEKGSSTKTVRHVPPTVLFVPPAGALEAMKAHRVAIVLDLDAMYDENDDAVDIVAKFRAFEQAQAIILSQPASSTTTTASAATGEGSFLSPSASPTPRRSWAATRSRSKIKIKRSRRGPTGACIFVGITANEEAQEQARAVGGFDVLALKPLSTDQALALLLRFFPSASSSSSPLDGSP